MLEEMINELDIFLDIVAPLNVLQIYLTLFIPLLQNNP